MNSIKNRRCVLATKKHTRLLKMLVRIVCVCACVCVCVCVRACVCEFNCYCIIRTETSHCNLIGRYLVRTCWCGLCDQLSLMSGSQKSFTSFNMVFIRVEPSCLVLLALFCPWSSKMYSP